MGAALKRCVCSMHASRHLRQFKQSVLTTVLTTLMAKPLLRALEPEAHDTEFMGIVASLLSLVAVATASSNKAAVRLGLAQRKRGASVVRSPIRVRGRE